MPIRVPSWQEYDTMSRAQRIATGPDGVRAAEALRRGLERQKDWPFPHIYAPQNSVRRDPNGYVQCPAAGVQAQILQFQVPQGHWFYLREMGLYFTGSSYSIGDFFFTVDRNVPLGAMVFQGVPETDWQAIPYPLGTPEQGPVSLPRAELYAPSNILRAKVTNVNLAGGPPQNFGAWFGGYLLPESDAPRSQQ